MANRTIPINLTNFTGGLNLRADAFELGDGESPSMLNVDIDPRGGFVARKGWTNWSSGKITAGTWNPRTIFIHELSDGSERVYVANDGKLLATATGVVPFTTQQAAGTDVVANAAPHGADFAPWGDTLYVACGKANQGVRIVGTTATRLTAGAAATWREIESPSGTVMPRADFVASHSGYLFVASTSEDSTSYPHRIRWSHPNNPEQWRSSDYIDIFEGGGPITGLVPNRDHLLIFKQSSVWALFGYDSDSWQLVNVTRERGAPTRQAIARSEQAVFFYSHLAGVYMIAGDGFPKGVSEPLRPLFEDGFADLPNEVGLGWVDQRLWFACPYDPTANATTSVSVFMMDPTVGGGAWTRYTSAHGGGVGPFGQGGYGAGGAELPIVALRSFAQLMLRNASTSPVDSFVDGTTVTANVEAYYVTRWLDGGYPTLKKSWRRPDLVVKERSQAYELTIETYRDYDEANVTREKVVNVDAGSAGPIWGSFVWGDGSIYGPPAKGSRIERGGNLGSARTVQLRISGEAGKPWGVDAIVFKFIPRRMR